VTYCRRHHGQQWRDEPWENFPVNIPTHDVITTCTGTALSKTMDRFIDGRRGGRHKAAFWKCRLHCMHRWHGHAVLAMSTTLCLQDAR